MKARCLLRAAGALAFAASVFAAGPLGMTEPTTGLDNGRSPEITVGMAYRKTYRLNVLYSRLVVELLVLSDREVFCLDVKHLLDTIYQSALIMLKKKTKTSAMPYQEPVNSRVSFTDGVLNFLGGIIKILNNVYFDNDDEYTAVKGPAKIREDEMGLSKTYLNEQADAILSFSSSIRELLRQCPARFKTKTLTAAGEFTRHMGDLKEAVQTFRQDDPEPDHAHIIEKINLLDRALMCFMRAILENERLQGPKSVITAPKHWFTPMGIPPDPEIGEYAGDLGTNIAKIYSKLYISSVRFLGQVNALIADAGLERIPLDENDAFKVEYILEEILHTSSIIADGTFPKLEMTKDSTPISRISTKELASDSGRKEIFKCLHAVNDRLNLARFYRLDTINRAESTAGTQEGDAKSSATGLSNPFTLPRLARAAWNLLPLLTRLQEQTNTFASAFLAILENMTTLLHHHALSSKPTTNLLRMQSKHLDDVWDDLVQQILRYETHQMQTSFKLPNYSSPAIAIERYSIIYRLSTDFFRQVARLTAEFELDNRIPADKVEPHLKKIHEAANIMLFGAGTARGDFPTAQTLGRNDPAQIYEDLRCVTQRLYSARGYSDDMVNTDVSVTGTYGGDENFNPTLQNIFWAPYNLVMSAFSLLPLVTLVNTERNVELVAAADFAVILEMLTTESENRHKYKLPLENIIVIEQKLRKAFALFFDIITNWDLINRMKTNEFINMVIPFEM